MIDYIVKHYVVNNTDKTDNELLETLSNAFGVYKIDPAKIKDEKSEL